MIFLCQTLTSLVPVHWRWIVIVLMDVGSHKYCPALPFQLDHYCRYILVAGEAQYDSAADEVEVCIEGMRIIKLDSDGHDGQPCKEIVQPQSIFVGKFYCMRSA